MVAAPPRAMAIVGAMFAAIVLASCGSQSPAGDEPPASQAAPQTEGATTPEAAEPGKVDLESLDACQLVAASVVGDAVGTTVQSTPIDEQGAVGCAYGSDTATPVTVLISESFVNLDAVEIPAGTEEVSGIGDIAYWHPTFNRLYFISDGYDVQVMVTIDGGDPRAVAESVGSAVASSLP